MRRVALTLWTAVCLLLTIAALPAPQALERKTLTPTGKKKVRCHAELDNLPDGKLAPGDYQLTILARDAEGTELVKRTVPLLVEAASGPAQAAR